ncbi:MAG: hypothetical protein CL681_28655 [Blastopirellula sp.]|nr:hypothetical protein [Blastopirellula sp.]
MTKKDAPLTIEEMQAAADIFFPLYDVVASNMPEARVEDILKVMENVAKLAHRERSKKREEEINTKFGFNKGEVTADEE